MKSITRHTGTITDLKRLGHSVTGTITDLKRLGHSVKLYRTMKTKKYQLL